MKPQTGFTLIELMMVLIIAGILASVGLPYMRDSLLNSRVRTAASDAHLSLLMARSEAIKRNRNVNINRTGADWANGWSVCVAEPSPNEADCDPAIETMSVRNALEDVTVACNTNTDPAADTCPAQVAFNRFGRPVVLIEYRFYVQDNTRVFARCAKISVSGVPRVVTDLDNDPDNGCG